MDAGQGQEVRKTIVTEFRSGKRESRSRSVKSVNRSYVVGQRQYEFAAAGRNGAGERAPAQNFQRSVVGERKVVVGRLQCADI